MADSSDENDFQNYIGDKVAKLATQRSMVVDIDAIGYYTRSPGCMNKVMSVQEARKGYQDRSKWQSEISAYPFGKQLYCCLLQSLATPGMVRNSIDGDCSLMGYMTDVQSWVSADGILNPIYVDYKQAIDTSYLMDPVPILQQKLINMKSSPRGVKFLSMANCGLTRVPSVFQLKDSTGHYLADTVEYMTFYGNMFTTFEYTAKEYDEILNATGAIEIPITTNIAQDTPLIWSASLQNAELPRLRELDLRACFIQILSPHLFRGLKNLEALYIGENEIFRIDAEAFVGLQNLRHLDFSRNSPVDEDGHATNLVVGTYHTFESLKNLVSLDLSHTKLTSSNLGMISSLGKSLRSLSLCNTGLRSMKNGILNRTSLEVLDISRNNGFFSSNTGLRGLEKSLVVLFARETGLKTLAIFKHFRELEILQLSINEITNVSNTTVKSLKNLRILDLDKNRLSSWFGDIFSLMPNLRYLSLRENNINMMSEEMILDLEKIDYLALATNFMVCNCHVKDFYRMTAANELKFNDTKITSSKYYLHHAGYDYYNKLIFDRKPVPYDFDTDAYDEMEDTGRFRLLDYGRGLYTCFKFPESTSVLFSAVTGCNAISRDQIDYDIELSSSWNKLLILLVIPCTLLPMLLIFIFRRNLRYCLIIMRNSAMLSMINKNEVVEDSTIFNYDVFVSYCNEDRGWVLDHLLPHMERECSVSACLHERDFQVGLSILENIVSCMDRSRSIMLIISQRFLLSQWCQFEMHLAQHRLLETRREDLILVLLEDIPRRLRPNTLHYLMLTKTYIVWPKSNVSVERAIFWRRLQKSLLSQKVKHTENVSLA